MFRVNRGRIIGLLLTSFIIYFLFLSSSNSSPSDFRKRTEDGLLRRHGILQGDISDESYRAQTNQRLNDILYNKQQQQQQQEPERKPLGKTSEAAPKRKSNEDDNDDDAGKDTSVAGRKTMPGKDKQAAPQAKEAEKPKYPKQQPLKEKVKDEDDDEDTPATKKTKTSSDPAKDLAREKLQEYLKKPIVIFSKTYCPHSKRAKQLLLETYKITPTPQVVELDQLGEKLPLPPRHKKSADGDEEDEEEDNRVAPTLGAKIQEILFEISGRRTVPNIMVGGTTSIGGNDLLWEMHEEGTLRGKVMELAGKRIVSMDVVDERGSKR